MTNQQMITYLKNVVDLEKAKYEQERTIGGLEYKISRLGLYAGYQTPPRPNEYRKSISFGDDLWEPACTFGAAGAFVGLFFGKIILGAVIGFFGIFLITFIYNAYYERCINNARQEDYQKELAQYRRNVEIDKKRVEKELVEKKHLQELLERMRIQCRETTSTLKRYYDLNIIFPKYRNMTAMCSIYEYYLSGRCDSLSGHEGAYNILESEIRFGVIFTKLDDIMNKLEDIKTNQSILYDAIESGNKLTNKLINASVQQAQQLEFIAEKTELAAYNANRAANEANQLKWIKILELSERNR